MPNHAKRCLFLQRARKKQAAWASGARQQWAGHLAQLAGWIERVTVQVNPQVPAYLIALPHPVARLLGQPYEKALAELESRCRTVVHSLATLGIGCVRLDDEGILEMLTAFYHLSLPIHAAHPAGTVWVKTPGTFWVIRPGTF